MKNTYLVLSIFALCSASLAFSNAVAVSANTVEDTQTSLSNRIDWDAQDRYWSGHYKNRPYYKDNMTYDDYRPAYRFGADMYGRYGNDSRYDDLDAEAMRKEWRERHSESIMSWEDANEAARDSYERLHEDREEPSEQSF